MCLQNLTASDWSIVKCLEHKCVHVRYTNKRNDAKSPEVVPLELFPFSFLSYSLVRSDFPPLHKNCINEIDKENRINTRKFTSRKRILFQLNLSPCLMYNLRTMKNPTWECLRVWCFITYAIYLNILTERDDVNILTTLAALAFVYCKSSKKPEKTYRYFI